MSTLPVSMMMTGNAVDAKLRRGMYVTEARAAVARALGSHPNKVRLLQGENASYALKDDEKLEADPVYVMLSAEADEWTAPPSLWQQIGENVLTRLISQNRLHHGIWRGTDLCGKIGCVIGAVLLVILVIGIFNSELDCAYKVAMDFKAGSLVSEAPCQKGNFQVRPGQLLHFQDCPVNHAVDFGKAARSSKETRAPEGLQTVFDAFKDNLPVGNKSLWMDILVEHVKPTGDGWIWQEVTVDDATGPWAVSGVELGTWNLSEAVILRFPGEPMKLLESPNYKGFQQQMGKKDHWEHLFINSSNMQLGPDGVHLYSQPGRPTLNSVFSGAQSYDIRVSFTAGAADHASVIAQASGSELEPWVFKKSRWLQFFPGRDGVYSLSLATAGNKTAKEMLAANTRRANNQRFIADGVAALFMIVPIYFLIWPDDWRYFFVEGHEVRCMVKCPRASTIAIAITLMTIISSHLLVWYPLVFTVLMFALVSSATCYTLTLEDYDFDEETTPLVGNATAVA
mmetsp:Transcript_98911/g.180930  ORF Transcript_98911/g.180930 Transcript_98911/m.180930 type:complete len:511 (-) Transcript_98911:99-1631(-)